MASKHDHYGGVQHLAHLVDYTEVSEDDYRLLESYVESVAELVLITAEPPDQIAEYVRIMREKLEKQQKQQEKQKEKYEKREKARLAAKKRRALSKAMALLQQEGMTVEKP